MINWCKIFNIKPKNRRYIDAYSIVYFKNGEVGIHCYNCKLTSYHPEDVKRQYLHCCGKFRYYEKT